MPQAILHFHGPKPFDGLPCYVDNPGSWKRKCAHLPGGYRIFFKWATKLDGGKYLRAALREFLDYLAQSPRRGRVAEFSARVLNPK